MPELSEYVDGVRIQTEEKIRWVFDAAAADVEILAPNFHELALAYALSGGKRLRATFASLGFQAEGREQNDELSSLCAALELLHAFALVHDDIMDDAALRRGSVTPHVLLAEKHEKEDWTGEARRYGEGIAILLGDYLYTLANAVIPGSLRPLWIQQATELLFGQYFDVHATASGARDVEMAEKIAIYKSAKYSVERPLQLGATLAGVSQSNIEFLCSFGRGVGEAFQLRDDLLGVFGNVEETGKSTASDIREGKPTQLLVTAIERTAGADHELLMQVGNQDLVENDVVRAVEIIESSGAREAIEQKAQLLFDQSMAFLDKAQIDDAIASLLRQLAERSIWRNA